MRTLTITAALLLATASLSAQDLDKIINPAAVEKVERSLASDDMQGRKPFKPSIEKAADYIESQFKEAGLQTFNGAKSYRQPFSMFVTKVGAITATLDGQPIAKERIFAISTSAHLTVDNNSGYEVAYIKQGQDYRQELSRNMRSKKNTLVLVDSSFASNFPRMANSNRPQFQSDRSIVFVLTSTSPKTYSITIDQELTESKLANVVGVIPGKSKKNEYVIFSGHYDHLGIGKPDAKGDSIYNGANDDASGVTAVINLAHYFAKAKVNERTLIFVAFTAEEMGGFGSQYFSNQMDPASVMAMFNIEMIGTASKWGPNSAFITGYEKSDMAKILEKNLTGTGFTFHPDPYPDQQLFYRSDNATLARQGVPAHTVSTFEIDVDKHYHTPDDDIDHLDMKNMAAIIRSIALSSRTIIEGKDTPTRVDATQLR
ncbi:MAG: M28 family peptidase [Bacteroidetes bacterium]|nr:M28 family peptidase [Bacteroidota bacterium]